MKIDPDIKHTTLNMDIVKNNVPQYSTEKLCDMIVCDRYFGFEQKISVVCMEELAKRRASGDSFDFESYIDKAYSELPVLNFETPDLRAVLGQALKNKNKL